ncbi:uncharacterized protein EHS24_008174 [Apiotrichum porosum]|uniref:Uncharacterized protein n=1 Tax=Apiotrichum porosum TaxID=105984 RepID=A0A427XT07_9TREE|nr:uncharacterized protein EHS24_008174 [Apiotrichum porosum]RSH81974.1 hypothetical protein EHS24_008174 [Apiotrichum porosum]
MRPHVLCLVPTPTRLGFAPSTTSSHSMAGQQVLHAVAPPPPPSDLIASALSIPLSQVGAEHVGRKLRLLVQILDIDNSASHILVTGAGHGARPTILMELSVALLGHSPGVLDVSHARAGYAASTTSLPTRPTPSTAVSSTGTHPSLPPGPTVPRQRLVLARGEWITVVGWLEPSALADVVVPPPGFLQPPRCVLEAIFIAPAREPPVGAIFRGEIPF